MLARYNHTYGITGVGMSGLCFPALNYYREMSIRETFPEFKPGVSDPPAGKSIYVVSEVNDRGFIDREKLAIAYRGKYSTMAIAVRPGGPIPPIVIQP